MTNRVVLIDRDGVVNRDIPGSVRSVEDYQLIPGADLAIAEICSLGFRVLVITNQACIGRGETDMKTVEIIHQKMCRDILRVGGKISDIFICPHIPEDNCACRKPLPGLIFQAQAKHHFEMAKTWFVGDAVRDIEAAHSAGCRPAGVRTGQGMALARCFEKLPIFNDLREFSGFLKNSNPPFSVQKRDLKAKIL